MSTPCLPGCCSWTRVASGAGCSWRATTRAWRRDNTLSSIRVATALGQQSSSRAAPAAAARATCTATSDWWHERDWNAGLEYSWLLGLLGRSRGRLGLVGVLVWPSGERIMLVNTDLRRQALRVHGTRQPSQFREGSTCWGGQGSVAPSAGLNSPGMELPAGRCRHQQDWVGRGSKHTGIFTTDLNKTTPKPCTRMMLPQPIHQHMLAFKPVQGV
jgi:hypothetical protein